MYNILNWNTGLTEKTEEDESRFAIFEFVKSFLQDKFSIAVLQQIPYKTKKKIGGWKISKIYEDFISFFPEKEYQIFENKSYNNGFVIMMTVIVSQNEVVKPGDDSLYPNRIKTNREVAMTINGEFSLLGLHAKNGEANLSYLKSINSNADIIVGDFNAGDYDECQNREAFKEILPDHVCICNLPTKRVENYDGELLRETCIDHIYVKRKLITRCSNVVIHKENRLSDHYPITFCIKSSKIEIIK